MSSERYGRAPERGHIHKTREMDPREMSAEEAIVDIGRLLGYHTAGSTVVPKDCLWSAYWALTGETFCPRDHLGTPLSPHTGQLRYEVAREAGFFYSQENCNNTTETKEEDHSPRPYRLNQRRALVLALRETEDKRPHGPNGE